MLKKTLRYLSQVLVAAIDPPTPDRYDKDKADHPPQRKALQAESSFWVSQPWRR